MLEFCGDRAQALRRLPNSAGAAVATHAVGHHHVGSRRLRDVNGQLLTLGTPSITVSRVTQPHSADQSKSRCLLFLPLAQGLGRQLDLGNGSSASPGTEPIDKGFMLL